MSRCLVSKPPRPRSVLVVPLTAAVAWLAAAGVVEAQPRRQQGPSLPRPVLRSVFPLGVQQGHAVEVTARGSDLEGVSSLWFDHPGLTATLVKGTTFRVTCSADTPAGLHDVRAAGPYGISNPRVI